MQDENQLRLLLFSVKEMHYCLNIDSVIEVLPVVNTKSIPRAPKYVSGLIDYRGMVVPLIDITHLMSGKQSRQYFSTRIVIVNYMSQNGMKHTLGLLVEKATEMISCSEEDFEESGVTVEKSPYLGAVLRSDQGIVQLLSIDDLLPVTVQAILFDKSGVKES